MPNASDIWSKQWMLGTLRALLGLFRRICASLTSRILTLTVTSTVLTALLVTIVSIQSIHGFLSEQLNQQFPALLSRTEERLNLWYSQIRLDVETFSRSQTLQNGLGALQRAPRGVTSPPPRSYQSFCRLPSDTPAHRCGGAAEPLS